MGKQIKTQIGKLGRIVTGKTPPTKVLEYFGDRYPFITPSDISDYSIKYLATTERYLSEKGKEYQKSLLIPENTVCFVAIGSTVGKMCYTKTKSFTNQQIHSIIVDENKHNPHYLFYKIHYEYPKIKSIADANGAGKPIINKTDFSNIEIEVSDLSTQQKIASILSAYDDLIENNTRRIKILEEMAQTIYKEWFVNFRFPGHEKVNFVDSPLGKIPEGWQVRKLGDIIELAYGKGLKSDSRIEGEYPVYGSSGVVGSHNEYLVNGPGVVVGRKGNVGSVFYSLKSFFPIDTTFYVKSELKLLYIFYLLSNMSFINNDAAVPGLNRNAALLIQVICPSKNLIKDFSNHVQAIFNLTETLKQKNQNLRKTRDLLLPKLMSGEVPVSVLPSKDGEV